MPHGQMHAINENVIFPDFEVSDEDNPITPVNEAINTNNSKKTERLSKNNCNCPITYILYKYIQRLGCDAD